MSIESPSPPRGKGEAEVVDLERLLHVREFAGVVDFAVLSARGPIGAAMTRIRDENIVGEAACDLLDGATRDAAAAVLKAYRRQLGFSAKDWERIIPTIEPVAPEDVKPWRRK